MFFLSGIFLVLGATMLIVQNTDVLLAGVGKAGRTLPLASCPRCGPPSPTPARRPAAPG